MDHCLPTRVLGLISRQPGVLLPPPINEIYGTLRNTRPRKRRNSIDNRSEFAERLPNLTRHRFARFSSVHRATKLDSRTMQHASDTIPFPSTTSGNTLMRKKVLQATGAEIDDVPGSGLLHNWQGCPLDQK